MFVQSLIGSALTALMVVELASAVPRYIAIPLEDLEVINMGLRDEARARAPRATSPWDQQEGGEAGQRVGGGGGWDQQPEQDGRVERQAGGHHHEHVDYGAHTGHHGAFGWYADFPVITHH